MVDLVWGKWEDGGVKFEVIPKDRHSIEDAKAAELAEALLETLPTAQIAEAVGREAGRYFAENGTWPSEGWARQRASKLAHEWLNEQKLGLPS